MTPQHWTREEIVVLIRMYPRLGKMETARRLGKSEAAVRQKASREGLKIKRGTRFWNDFQKRAAESKVGKPLSPDHIAKATQARRLAMVGRPKQLFSKKTRALMSANAKRLWKRDYKRMCKASRAGHTEEAKMKRSASLKAWWDENKDRYLTDEVRQAKSDAMTKTAARRKPENSFSRCRRGFREDLGIYVRSMWEANYARYLKWLVSVGEIKDWKYEPKTFWFEKVRRGVRSYKPDFCVTTNKGSEEYHEVKGWMTDKSATALKRMRIYYPEVVMVLIDEKRYNAIKRTAAQMIKHWEAR